jgi:hypothetical protein
MKKLGLGLAFALMASTAYAGLTQPAEVDVDLVNGTALGDQVSARYTADATQFIGCGTRRRLLAGGGYFDNGFCQAEDAAGEQITCFTTDAGLLEAIQSSGDYGFITFSWDVATSDCTRIGFSNQSFYLPKKLDRN